jgi:hypothetical protein
VKSKEITKKNYPWERAGKKNYPWERAGKKNYPWERAGKKNYPLPLGEGRVRAVNLF